MNIESGIANNNCQILTANDLHEDMVLIRKIKRVQRAEAQGAEEEESESEEETVTRSRTQTQTRDLSIAESRMKSESRASVPASQMPPPSSEVIDMGDPSDEEDDE